MTIPFEGLKARLLANPKVKAEYDALVPEFEIAADLLRARLCAGLSQAELAARMGDQPVGDRATRERSNATKHEDTAALCRGHRQQVPRPAVGGLMRYFDRGGACNRAIVKWRARPMKMGAIASLWRYEAAAG